MANEIPEALEKDKKTVTKASAKKTTTKKTAAKKTAAKTTAKKATAKKAAKPSSKLVIVESPAKAKTIQKYLGKGYEVMASMGHVRDLPKSRLGVDIEHDFQPEYIDIRGKGELRNQLKKAAKHSSFVYLATDPDREGEAISWHLSNMLGLDNEEKNRVTFNEITKTGIKNGMAAPRNIDINLVNAQQTRRILDRLVGYKLSPFLWKTVKPGLSAGRVQSVVVKLIVDRERRSAILNRRSTGPSTPSSPPPAPKSSFLPALLPSREKRWRSKMKRRQNRFSPSWRAAILSSPTSKRASRKRLRLRPSSPRPCSRRLPAA